LIESDETSKELKDENVQKTELKERLDSSVTSPTETSTAGNEFVSDDQGEVNLEEMKSDLKQLNLTNNNKGREDSEGNFCSFLFFLFQFI
jgi:hypothetical protein